MGTMNSERLYTRFCGAFMWQSSFLGQGAWTPGKLHHLYLHRRKAGSGVMLNTALADIPHRSFVVEHLQASSKYKQSHQALDLDTLTE
ncbi:hypothetical protein HBI81_243320 [Parastagonospora nodorum]|nr:hypothetical protein HBI81_243320 [Parastagonospora nodorum]